MSGTDIDNMGDTPPPPGGCASATCGCLVGFVGIILIFMVAGWALEWLSR